jgi:hypothetical protein
MLGEVAEVIAVISIIGHFLQYRYHKSQEKVLLGFLHALKPPVESAAAGHVIPSDTWARMKDQINDMLERLQPPAKLKSSSRKG